MSKKTHLQTYNASPFTLVDIMIVFAFIGVGFLLFFFRIVHFEVLLGNENVDYSIRILNIFLLQEVLFLFPVVSLMLLRYRSSCRQSCGFISFPILKALKSIFGWYLVYIVTMYVFSLVTQWLRIDIPGFGEGRSVLPLFGKDENTMFVLILVIVCIAPLVEEIFFRGFLFRTLLNKGPYIIASLFTAILFATIHLDFGAFFPRFILGLILNHIVMEHNRSIIPAIMFHMLNNSIALVITLYLP